LGDCLPSVPRIFACLFWMNRHRNQYAPAPSDRAFVQDLLTTRCRVTWSDAIVFKCLIPEGVGISLSASGYCRINRNGCKVLAHKIVLETLVPHPNAADLDVSHLCSIRQCCNPEHLVYETHEANTARRGCAGYTQVDEGQWIRVCHHEPPCKIVTRGIVIDEPPFEQ